jgi:hypothetical protein
MYSSKTALRLGSVVAIVALAGCVSNATIRSNKMASYAGGIHKLYIDADYGGALLSATDQERKFVAEMTGTLASCGTETNIREHDPLEMQADAFARVRQFGPDAITTMGWHSKTALAGGALAGTVQNIIYELGLLDVKTHQVVWKAEVNFAPRGDSGVILADTILGKMKADGLISASCAVASSK